MHGVWTPGSHNPETRQKTTWLVIHLVTESHQPRVHICHPVWLVLGPGGWPEPCPGPFHGQTLVLIHSSHLCPSTEERSVNEHLASGVWWEISFCFLKTLCDVTAALKVEAPVHLGEDTGAQRGLKETELMSHPALGSAQLGMKGPAHPQNKEFPGVLQLFPPTPGSGCLQCHEWAAPIPLGKTLWCSSITRVKEADNDRSHFSIPHGEAGFL